MLPPFMATRKLPNYLRSHRKRAGLSQDEVAYLLGCRDGTKVSRYERRTRVPNLETALACEVLFGAAGRELFAGMYEKVSEDIHKRAQVLAEKLSAEGSGKTTRRKLEHLAALTSSGERESHHHAVSTTG